MVKRKSVPLLFYHTSYTKAPIQTQVSCWVHLLPPYQPPLSWIVWHKKKSLAKNYSNFNGKLLKTSGPVQHSQYSNLLQAGWSGDWTLVEARFSVPVQTGPAAHPAFCTMGITSLSSAKMWH
jgi:hypothetical protein